MRNFWRRVKPFGWGVLCVGLALICSPVPWSISYAISTHDVAPIWSVIFHPLFAWTLVLPHLCLVVGAPIVFVASWKIAKLRPLRYYALLVWPLSWGLFASFIGSNAGWPARRAGLQNAARRAQPIIAAIERYKTDNGRPPADLEALVPRYLPEIPATGMAAYREFRYSSHAKRPGGAAFGVYELSVDTTFGLSFDRFYYWPDRDYPISSSSGDVERVGDWAYLHE